MVIIKARVCHGVNFLAAANACAAQLCCLGRAYIRRYSASWHRVALRRLFRAVNFCCARMGVLMAENEPASSCRWRIASAWHSRGGRVVLADCGRAAGGQQILAMMAEGRPSALLIILPSAAGSFARVYAPLLCMARWHPSKAPTCVRRKYNHRNVALKNRIFAPI